jgi:hypothetical protein
MMMMMSLWKMNFVAIEDVDNMLMMMMTTNDDDERRSLSNEHCCFCES